MKTVYVGLSGGVDSSVAAALLLQDGYRVVGVYMKNWTKDTAGVICPWKTDLADARRVAAQLGIPFKVFDYQDQYKARVVDTMIEQYRLGRTPNPDVLCNSEVKFKLFADTAFALGADYIATGHYARVTNRQLYQGKDKAKDQSYFLYRINPSVLDKALMPLGNLTKTQVRKLAKTLGLATATKPDSQGICFVGEVGIKQFLSEYLDSSPGVIIHQESKESVGLHDGAIFYTIGQRHGLSVGGGQPYYVVGKDLAKNEVYVTEIPRDSNLYCDQYLLTHPNWLAGEPIPANKYQVRHRHQGGLIPAKLQKSQDGWLVKLSRPERAITAGQSAVVYSGNLVIGGGISMPISVPDRLHTR